MTITNTHNVSKNFPFFFSSILAMSMQSYSMMKNLVKDMNLILYMILFCLESEHL